MNSKLSQFGGIANLLTRGKSDDLSFLVEMAAPGQQPLKYKLHLATKGAGFSLLFHQREIRLLDDAHP
ncbi:MAG: hypothetical protein WAV08_05615 [Desulfobacterales bacterium]|nr:hypothetical protein [Desulfobacterales bacterium]